MIPSYWDITLILSFKITCAIMKGMENIKKTSRNYRKFILVVGIIVVLNLFFNFGVRAFYSEPKYNDFCTDDYYRFAPKPYPADPKDKVAIEAYEKEQTEIAKKQKECSDEYTAVRDLYNRNVFIVLVSLGVISIIAGFLLISAEAVSLGLSFGGLLSLVVGTMRYWSAMDEYLRFIVLGVALAILIWFGVKKMKD